MLVAKYNLNSEILCLFQLDSCRFRPESVEEWKVLEKCEFEKEKIEYLGLVISQGRIEMDPVKVEDRRCFQVA